jgi:hypothetical protein
LQLIQDIGITAEEYVAEGFHTRTHDETMVNRFWLEVIAGINTVSISRGFFFEREVTLNKDGDGSRRLRSQRDPRPDDHPLVQSLDFVPSAKRHGTGVETLGTARLRCGWSGVRVNGVTWLFALPFLAIRSAFLATPVPGPIIPASRRPQACSLRASCPSEII